MKRNFNFLRGYLIGIFLVALALTLCCSCNKLGMVTSEVIDKEYADSIIRESVQNYINPLFTNVDEVVEFRSLSAEAKVIDAEFEEMPETILRNVATVCLKRDSYASKRSIIYEYRANRQVYDNLPANAEPPASTTTEEAPKTEQKSTSAGGEPSRPDSASKGDTVINGKPYRAL